MSFSDGMRITMLEQRLDAVARFNIDLTAQIMVLKSDVRILEEVVQMMRTGQQVSS